MDFLPLILASTSPYRRELLNRLGLPFTVFAPGVDETPYPGEVPQDTALRLSREKALAAAAAYPNALIIGSDQVAVLEGTALGKPGNHVNAIRQLKLARGKSVIFYTALSLHNSRTGRTQSQVVPVTVKFRPVSDSQIERYLAREKPYDCAGSARVEGLGIALLESVRSEDPTALIGLPLITLVSLLENEGLRVI